MERLTKIDGIGQNEIIQCFGCGPEKSGEELERCGYCEHWQAVLDRLAAYEDTGLEPKEIPTGLELANTYAAMLLLKRYQALGPVEELAALVKAWDEGRAVVLPCKPSDVTVYQLRSKKHALGVGISPRIISCATVWGDGYYALKHQGADDCLKKDFGKTWFLTRAEAEAAQQGDGDRYPCRDHDCYDRGNFHAGCENCPQWIEPEVSAQREEGQGGKSATTAAQEPTTL